MDEKKLIMTFKNSLGNSFSLTLYDPVDNLDTAALGTFMSEIVSKNIFQPKGHALTEAVSAKVVESSTISFDLDI